MRKEMILSLILLVIAVLAIYIGSMIEPQNLPHPTAVAARSMVVPSRSFVHVYNGTMRPGLAARTTEILRSHGFDTHNRGDRRPRARDFERTLVISRTSEMDRANEVARILGVRTAFFLVSETEITNEITVIIGEDFREIESRGGGR